MSTNRSRLFILFSLAAVALIVAACAAPAAPPAPVVQTVVVPQTVAVPVPQTVVVQATAVPTKAPTAVVTAAPKVGGSITVAFYQEPNTLVLYFSNQTFTYWASGLYNPGLWTFDDKAQPVLELADVYPTTANGGVSADGKTITYKLKKGLKWSDGQPITSKDVKFTWQVVMNDKNAGIISRDGFNLITSIDTPDDLTAVVKFKEYYAPWYTLYNTTGGLLPEHTLGKETGSLDSVPFQRAPIGAGAFKVTEWKSGDHITFVANENYWRGKPKLDTVNIKIVPSREAAMAGLKAGDVDIAADMAESSIPDLQAMQPKATAYAVPSQDFEHYFFNLGTKANGGVDGPIFFQDVAVRKAYNMCIDRDTIAKVLLYGKTTTIGTLWPNSAYTNPNVKPYPFDVAGAKKLLDDAGWKPGDDGIRAKTIGGKAVRISFNHETTTGNQLRADVQVLVTASLKACGMEMLPQNYPSGTLFGGFEQSGPLANGKYDTGGYTTSFSPDPDPADTFQCDGIPTKDHPDGSNWYRLCDPDLEKLSKAQKSEADETKRKAIIGQMQQMMYDKAYVAPLYNRLHVSGLSTRLQGVVGGPTQIDIYWNTYNWYVTQ
ncbi:MAG: peptide ABC transporter substrate-binding protein [Chloroflexota bacterium]|nr:peptide ABC transporter substrate-binding protein [Chloroflexota bacterium]